MKTTPEWFVTKFKLDELTIKQFENWTWSLRPAQCTLGASVLSLNRPAEAWGELTSAENAELALVVEEIERRLKASFSYDKINYLMLMMVDPHVHFHVIPRYAASKIELGTEWRDANWPKPPDVAVGLSDTDVLAQVLAHIKKS